MSLPRELDEYDDDEITKEVRRRAALKRRGCCHYCGRRLDNGTACKLYPHDVSTKELEESMAARAIGMRRQRFGRRIK